ncbi:MAG: pyridoxamine 5'-phosphate oxidase family protein [Actinomycetota bacterium]|jgi:hypothetical protein|nr:pyridoxamine 5'-phosphate oxidase family protein [Actinomycetota bacterium]
MWSDEHGSEVLVLAECRRLLAVGAKHGLHGHLGISGQGAPVVLPVDYGMDGPDIVVQIGEGLFHSIAEHGLVAFLVDGVENGRVWSVLVRGYSSLMDHLELGADSPHPRVLAPGNRLVKIRSDVVTGRRFTPAMAAADQAPA